jgi:hypothetical protein
MTDYVVIGLILIAAVILDVTAVLLGYDSRDTCRADRGNDYQFGAPARVR